MNISIDSVLGAYRAGETTPAAVVDAVYERIDVSETNVWISVREKRDLIAEAAALADIEIADTPLYGVPFAVKDNIDYAGLPTTAGCPEYAYEPTEHATVVEKLVEAGALLIGKTNMDQFATGLVGTRSPYGACRNVYNEAYIAGGSSSGSAVAVARGDVAFALGTDTAGSGRVPPALNGLVGIKPTRGMLSTTGVVPACASLDCVAVFAPSVSDCLRVTRIAAGFDAADPYSRRESDDSNLRLETVDAPRIGVPAPADREFFGDAEAERLFRMTIEQFSQVGDVVEVDFEPFAAAAELLYGGPWVAERFAAVGDFMTENPGASDPIVEEIIRGGESYSARETFEAFYKLQALATDANQTMSTIDVLVVPTVPTVYTVDAVREQPITLNSNLGYYNNFVNLFDLSAVTVPVGTFAAGPMFGVTVIGETFADSSVATVARELRSASVLD